eukprot:gnl/MRDRNA2_/MRDRNA2_29156_c0_seq1.p1 gnl/MRDRNA2_/MRDRNA2_29156_c0~~gnl/MRDRNA2_/MRDRNA2_29156_c0_seq1.p1  ORF type:complete len:169 (+),score=36.93 gnl/MRDRNA2_/MRDRNA2_29156_c0_seq1:112-618(+)
MPKAAFLPDRPLPYELEDRCGFRDMQIQDFAWSYQISDILGDGLVTTKELRRILGRLGEQPTSTELTRVINEIDPHGKGILNFQQFVTMMSYFGAGILITEEEVMEAFKIFDRDASGSIESGELRHVLQTLGDKLTEEEADMMLAEADADGDGEIDYNEFCQTILRSQ